MNKAKHIMLLSLARPGGPRCACLVSLLSLLAPVSLLTPGAALAQDDFGFDFGAEAMEAPPAKPFVPEKIESLDVALDLQFIDNDNRQFGRYNGLYDDGAYLDLGLDYFDWQQQRQSFFAFDAKHLGTDERELSVSTGNFQGTRFTLGYQQISRWNNDTGRTPFSRENGNRWVLPGDWQAGATTAAMTTLPSSLHNFDEKLERNRWTFDGRVPLAPHWSLAINLQQEDKTGTQTRGVAHFFNASSGFAVLLPDRVDQTTRQGSVSVQFVSQRLQLSGQYMASRFDNQNESLEWQNPYTNVVFAPADFPDGFGRLAGAPDNEFQQLRLQGMYSAANNLQFKWDLAGGKMTQDEQLLPYTINAINTPIELPVESPDVEVKTWHAKLAALYRPDPKTTVDARYVFDERDNQTSRYLFAYVSGDSYQQHSLTNAVYNVPTGYSKEKASLDVSRRLPKRFRLKLAYDFIATNRDNASVEKTEEDRYRAQLQWSSMQGTAVRLKYQYSDRQADTYYYDHALLSRFTTDYINALPSGLRYRNHPLMQQYYLADREQDEIALHISQLINSQWSLDLDARYQDNSYPDTALGLTDQSTYEVVFTANLQLNESISAYAFVAVNEYENEQVSRHYRGGIDGLWPDTTYPINSVSNPNNDWFATLTDSSTSVGIGGQWQIRPDKLTLHVDYLYVDTQNEVDISSRSDNSLEALPDTETRSQDFTAKLSYQYDKQTELNIKYRYFWFEDDDWAYAGLSPQTVDNLLASGARLNDDVVNLLGLSVKYRFE